MMRETEKWIIYETEDFLKDVELIEEKLQPEKFLPLRLTGKKFDGVYGIPAGGLVLATYIHYRLEIPILLAPTKLSLIVDDIVDSGRTMSHYIMRGNFTLSLFWKKDSIWRPSIWLNEKYDKWIHFPWEGEEDGDGRLAR